MFTGIIEAMGTVGELKGGRLILRAPLAAELKEADSIAVNGVCLTALAPDKETVQFDLSPETLMRTNLHALAPGSPVNLERPLTPTSRLGGHIVQGHVDGVAELLSYKRLDAEGNHWLAVRVPPELQRYVAWKGSVALDGISLTIASLEKHILGVAIIPFTHTHTNLQVRKPGDLINMECDLIARYLERLMENIERPQPEEKLTVDRLIDEGF